jgi:sodium transport system permease protein
MWARMGVVFGKEVMDNARDRRSLLIALIYPLLGPLLLGLMLSVVGRVAVGGGEQNLTLHISGVKHGPALVDWLTGKGIEVVEAASDVKAAVRRGDLDVAVIIPPEFNDLLAAEQTAPITVVINSSRLSGLVHVNNVISLLGTFNNDVWGERIAARGVDFRSLQPIAIDNENVTSGAHIADILLFMVPPLFVFNLFMGGAYFAIDTTSGERERGSLEPLLINPIERSALVAGKFLAAFFYTGVAVVVQMIAFKLAFYWSSGAGDFSSALSALNLVAILIITLPLMLAAVAVQFIIATITRSFKEAQTYLGLLPLLPALPGMILVFATVKVNAWMMLIPAYSQTLLFGQILRGETLDPLKVALSMGSTLTIAIILFTITIQLYEREELIFGG